MQRTNLVICLVLLPALGAPVLAKSTTLLDNGDYLTVVDATAGGAFAADPHDFTYFSFERGDVVPLTDAEAEQSAEWHIAFKRSEIRLNGGISGPGNVSGFDINGVEDVVAEDAYDAVTSSDIPGSDAFIVDGPAYAVSEWYSYDPSVPQPRRHRQRLRAAHRRTACSPSSSSTGSRGPAARTRDASPSAGSSPTVLI